MDSYSLPKPIARRILDHPEHAMSIGAMGLYTTTDQMKDKYEKKNKRFIVEPFIPWLRSSIGLNTLDSGNPGLGCFRRPIDEPGTSKGWAKLMQHLQKHLYIRNEMMLLKSHMHSILITSSLRCVVRPIRCSQVFACCIIFFFSAVLPGTRIHRFYLALKLHQPQMTLISVEESSILTESSCQ